MTSNNPSYVLSGTAYLGTVLQEDVDQLEVAQRTVMRTTIPNPMKKQRE